MLDGSPLAPPDAADASAAAGPVTPVTPVLLCGGAGTRLWPLSRRGRPKHLAPLAGGESLLRTALGRLSGPGFAPPVIVTAAPLRDAVAAEAAAAGIAPAALLAEPAARDTAAALLAAALHLARADPDAPMLAAPTDHLIPDPEGFAAAVRAAAPAARAGRIVAFGARPDRPEAGYGYLVPAAPPGPRAPTPLARFVEKPPRPEAARLIAEGALWNAGLFLASAAAFVAAFEAHAPDLIPPVAAALEAARPEAGGLRLDPAAWAGARAVSIDRAVMERAANLDVMPYAGAWSDLGDWEAVRRAGAGPDGTAAEGGALALDCAGTLLRAEAGAPRLVGLGLKDVIAVATPDAVLVADRARAQEVGRAVAALRAEGAPEADAPAREDRPWGWFERLGAGPRFQVKRIVVRPGGILSLQSHHHRAEHWVVVEGTARVTVGERVRLVGEDQSVYVPLGAVHRLENPGRLPLTLIEVQTGPYLGEDDIVRHADAYGRP